MFKVVAFCLSTRTSGSCCSEGDTSLHAGGAKIQVLDFTAAHLGLNKGKKQG